MIVETTLEAAGGVLPVYVGVSGNATRHLIQGPSPRSHPLE
jgi:dihydrodipicolinate synthase/N-acetylneuraminate lyase